ncbi:MAG: pantoate--beta-alanine ligase [Planctomycetota bacterium]|nr:pantoate--beta-alanine ligase [Planctomycetota bacterium]
MSERRVVLAAIAVGTNLGDRRVHLERALEALRALPRTRIRAVSSWHETEPVGGPPGQGRYLNGAVLVETGLAPRELLDELLAIESAEGRVRVAGRRDGPRTLDLDLLVHGAAVVEEPGLVLPHPRAEERPFVLEPLAEIAPDLRFPRSGLNVLEALARLRASVGGRRGSADGTVALSSPAEARAWCGHARARGARIGFVPTMGALHEGHLELVRRAARENDAAVVSVFVNPLQFDEKSDFERYPRDFAADVALLGPAGCGMAFTGTLAGFFPGELAADGSLPAAKLLDPGTAALGLEGAFRAGHFAGVATIVDRLFEVVTPHVAYFGEKDFQQTLVVRDLSRRRGAPPIVVCPTSREASGLARSSRNERLSPTERAEAAVIFRALSSARAAWRAGERRAAMLSGALRTVLSGSTLRVEYATVRDPEQWTADEPATPLLRAQALVAARLGAVRLIDNLRLDVPDGGVPGDEVGGS